MSSEMAPLLLLCLLLVSSARAGSTTCPQGCTCNDDTLVVSCVEANLDVIPITLNPAIQRLVLKFNKVKSVDAAFQFYGELQYVDLSHNALVSIKRPSFEAQKKLVEFHLDHNKIAEITNITFRGLKQLKVLSLRGNFLEDLPDRLFSALNILEELDLGQNRISRIDSAAFAGLPALRVLHLDDNMLKVIPTPTFVHLSSLAELHVGLNVFTTVPDETFNKLTKLFTLDLSDSSMINISENAFRGLVTLRKLVLTGNKLTTIPTKQLSNLTRVEELSIGQNEFKVIEADAFKGLTNLRMLDISGVQTLERVSKGCLLDNMNVESIVMSSNKRLVTIDDGAFAGLPNLRHLVLRDNAFTTFSESMVAWPELRKIDVSENPLHCSCELRWLKELLVQRNTSQVLCALPASLKNKPLKSVPLDDLGCALHSTRQQAIIGAICAAVAFFAAILALLVYRYRRTVQTALKNAKKWDKQKIGGKECEYQKTHMDDDYRLPHHHPHPHQHPHQHAHPQPYKQEPVTEL